MRWIFLLLFVLNVFYYVWHQQQAPLRAKEVASTVPMQEGRRNIRLLSESERRQRPARAPLAQPESACLFLGGFEQESAAAMLAQRLISLDIRARVEAVDATAGVDYWVYLPPVASRQASLRQLKELQARKIDSYIISQGELENGISLGIFPRPDSAESVMQRLRDAGYTPLLKELPRAHRNYWVRIAPESRRLADDSLLQALALDFSGLRHQLMPCESIATQQKID
ncbi:SPOR domain-containing protein [Pseudomonas zhanjiangensis]|uniref:SPOR domain-containing protein n=1 Tax=Pseudomonas zhanjiangensis TaxID=3239015 RepID=A0ABV3Z3F0_9PSED